MERFLQPYSDRGRITYFYAGTDSISYKSVTRATYNGMNDFDTAITYYSYDINDRIQDY